MHPPETHLPATAPTQGRLRQPRPWPYAPRPAELNTPTPPAPPTHDFLRILPEPALTGDLPAAAEPNPLILPPIPGPEAARTYWFDL